MELKIQLFSLLSGVIFLLVVLFYLKKSHMRPSSALLWLLLGTFLISIPILAPVYQWFSHSVIGIKDARTVIFFSLITFLLLYSFYLTVKLTMVTDHLQEVISKLAILEKKVRDE